MGYNRRVNHLAVCPLALNIRDHAILKSAAERLDELVTACRARGPVYGIDAVLAADVTRKAKALRTSLGKLREAADEPNHRPNQEEQMTKEEPLALRLNRVPVLYELARAVSYGGKRPGQLKEKCAELSGRYGDTAVMMAMHELTMLDPKTNLTVLRPEARKLCWQLLGPPPEHPDYQDYYTVNKRTPPAEHQPPPPEEEPAPKKRGRGR